MGRAPLSAIRVTNSTIKPEPELDEEQKIMSDCDVDGKGMVSRCRCPLFIEPQLAAEGAISAETSLHSVNEE